MRSDTLNILFLKADNSVNNCVHKFSLKMKVCLFNATLNVNILMAIPLLDSDFIYGSFTKMAKLIISKCKEKTGLF
jgi:hypothetical protein